MGYSYRHPVNREKKRVQNRKREKKWKKRLNCDYVSMQNITEIITKGAGFDHAHANKNSQFSSRSSQLAEKAWKSLIVG